MSTNPLLYLSLIGLLIKVFAAHRLKKNLHVPGANFCMILLIIAYTQTVLELFGFYANANGNYNALPILKIYYILIIASVLLSPVLFSNIINQKLNILWLSIAFVTFIFMCSLLQLDILIKGAVFTKYSIERVKGDYYWIFQLFVILSILMTIWYLIHTYRNTHLEIIKVKSANIIISFTPIAIFSILIILLMALKVPITAGGFIPILYGILAMIMVHTLEPNKIIDLRALIPGTKKFRLILKTIRPFIFCTSMPKYENHYEHYDESLITIADDQFKSNIEKAKWLGISEPTYYKKKAKLKNLKSKKQP